MQSTNSASGGVFRDRRAPASAPAPAATLVSQIKQRLPIEDVVSRVVTLKPAGGGELVGKCVFHEDDQPSMYVSPGEATYFCHGCQATGNVIHFEAHLRGQDYNQTKMELAKELGLTRERQLGGPERLLAATVERYRGGLSRSKAAQDYLISRNISVEAADKFGLGFCWGDEFARADEAMVADGKRAGLYSEKSSRSYLGGRLTFPIRSKDGRVIAFAGRTLPRPGAENKPAEEGRKPPPKYLNSPETEFFNKSEVLYGMYEARAEISRTRKAIVVEGYMDVIALHQAGATNTVAVMGASANEKAFESLWGWSDHIVFCLDGDTAGRVGTMRSVVAAAPPMKDGQTISIVFLPDGMDPDEYVEQHGVEAFNALVDKATPLSRYLVDLAKGRFNMDHAEQRAAFLEESLNAAAMFTNAPTLKHEIEVEARSICSAHVVRQALSGAGVALDDQEIAGALQILSALHSGQATAKPIAPMAPKPAPTTDDEDDDGHAPAAMEVRTPGVPRPKSLFRRT